MGRPGHLRDRGRDDHAAEFGATDHVGEILRDDRHEEPGDAAQDLRIAEQPELVDVNSRCGRRREQILAARQRALER